MSFKRYDIIRCPHCNAEYTAGEIYIPKSFLGVPCELEKEATTHRILFDAGEPMDTHEHFVCEYCNTPFDVDAYVTFSVKEDTIKNFNQNHVTTLRKNSLFLSEG